MSRTTRSRIAGIAGIAISLLTLALDTLLWFFGIGHEAFYLIFGFLLGMSFFWLARWEFRF